MPALKRWTKRMQSLPGCQSAFPNRKSWCALHSCAASLQTRSVRSTAQFRLHVKAWPPAGTIHLN